MTLSRLWFEAVRCNPYWMRTLIAGLSAQTHQPSKPHSSELQAASLRPRRRGLPQSGWGWPAQTPPELLHPSIHNMGRPTKPPNISPAGTSSSVTSPLFATIHAPQPSRWPSMKPGPAKSQRGRGRPPSDSGNGPVRPWSSANSSQLRTKCIWPWPNSLDSAWCGAAPAAARCSSSPVTPSPIPSMHHLISCMASALRNHTGCAIGGWSRPCVVLVLTCDLPG